MERTINTKGYNENNCYNCKVELLFMWSHICAIVFSKIDGKILYIGKSSVAD